MSQSSASGRPQRPPVEPVPEVDPTFMDAEAVAADRTPYDAVMVMSFGGPDKKEDVIPFLDNVLRGRNVPEERKLEVAEHYYHFGGKSPINEQNLALIEALREEFKREGVALPIYFGNRNWHPMVTDTLSELKAKGYKRVLSFFTSGFSCYSGCRQYRENIQAACELAGDGAPQMEKTRKFFNHPRFIACTADHIEQAKAKFTEEERKSVRLIFTAHSIPMGMAKRSNYERHFHEASRLAAEASGFDAWDCVYQSRSGPPQVPWLEPDILDHLEALGEQGVKNVIVSPIGFISDHMEVLFDLDTEAKELCEEKGMKFVRVATPGLHPEFISMIRELIQERIEFQDARPALGDFGPSHDVCPKNCCLPR